MIKTIEKMIMDEVKYELAEKDIDGLIKKVLKDDRIKDIAKTLVHEIISKTVIDSIYDSLKKNMPLIDAWTASKVKGFLLELGIK